MYYCVLIDPEYDYEDRTFRGYQNKIAKKIGLHPGAPLAALEKRLQSIDESKLDGIFFQYPNFEALKQGFIGTGVRGIKDATDYREIEDAYNKSHYDADMYIFNNVYEACIGVWHK